MEISSKLVCSPNDKALKPPFVFERFHQMNVYAFLYVHIVLNAWLYNLSEFQLLMYVKGILARGALVGVACILRCRILRMSYSKKF